MKRILFIIPHLWKGGAERILSELSLHLKGYKKTLVIFEPEINYPFDGELINLNLPPSANLIVKIKNFFQRIHRVKKIKDDCDVAISFLESANFVNVLSKKKEKTVISVHSDLIETFSKAPFLAKKLEEKLIKFAYLFLIRRFYTKADLCIAVSQGVKESLIKLGIPKEKIKVIYNLCSIEEIQQKANEEIEDFFEKSPYFITVGRLTKQKGQWHLLRVFKEIKRQFPELKLLILGEGELKHYLWKLSQKLNFKTYLWDKDNISENYDVYFLGFKENPFKYILRAKLFILPSLWEGFSNVLVEAMACGVPVISSDCKSGPREILAPDTDFRYQTKKPEFAKYGILMPVFEGDFVDKEPLTVVEKIWVEVLKDILKKEEMLCDYKVKVKERAMDFHVNKILQEWVKIIENS